MGDLAGDFSSDFTGEFTGDSPENTELVARVLTSGRRRGEGGRLLCGVDILGVATLDAGVTRSSDTPRHCSSSVGGEVIFRLPGVGCLRWCSGRLRGGGGGLCREAGVMSQSGAVDRQNVDEDSSTEPRRREGGLEWWGGVWKAGGGGNGVGGSAFVTSGLASSEASIAKEGLNLGMDSAVGVGLLEVESESAVVPVLVVLVVIGVAVFFIVVSMGS